MLSTWRRGAVLLLLALAVWGFFSALGAAPLLDDPNEAEYAEVAREMVESGDWITPRLNYVLFLNKPPLAYWLIGLSDLAFGINEYAARLPSAVAGLVIVTLLVQLGTLLFDVETGLLAGFVLIATAGFFLETHEVRPDLILTASIVGTFVAFTQLWWAPPALRRGPLIALQVSVAVGLLGKGLLAVLVPGVVCAALLAIERRADLVRELLRPRAWWLVVLLVAPWHVLVGLQHPGFAWDYIVNQHLLFFLDRKFPRDSEPVSLAVFWSAFALRLFPWTLFAPLACVTAMRRVRDTRQGYGVRLLLAWVAVVLLFFSAAASRMEHYSIPALPAVALLVAKLFRDYAHASGVRLVRAVTAHVVVWGLLILPAPFIVPGIITAQPWLASVHEMVPLARTTFGIAAAGALVAAAAALLGRRAWVAPPLIAAFAALIPCVHYGLELVARVNSSAPLAAAIGALAEPEEPVVFEAPVEYQQCATMNFYLRRKLVLVRPAGFVEPPYLSPHLDDLFISREQFEDRWRSERVFFITDPLLVRPHLDGAVPHPYYILARDRVRWVVTNQPLH